MITMDKAWVLERLRQVFQEAMDNGQLTAANRSLELIGKELKMFVDRKHVTTDPGDGMGKAALLAAIQEIDARLADMGVELPLIDVTPAPPDVA